MFHPALADRLWIQRPIPKPPKAAMLSLKRKRAGDSGSRRSNAGSSSKRLKHGVGLDQRAGKSKVQAKGKAKKAVDAPLKISIPSAGGRAAKAQAKIKLDIQARQLAELNRQAAIESFGSPRVSRRAKGNVDAVYNTRPLGTRLSARLRGTDAEWQPVPDEWLNEGADAGQDDREAARSSDDQKASERDHEVEPKTGLESDQDSISELTELSEDSEAKSLDKSEAEDRVKTEPQPVLEPESSPTRPPTPNDRGLEPLPILPEGFIEWETVSVLSVLDQIQLN